MKLQMVDLASQYRKIKNEIDTAVLEVMESSAFINGPKVKEFQQNLQKYLQVGHVIPVANGTDALQIALMALDLKHDDEIIAPAFTYVATAEVIGLLGLKPVLVDVDENTFNLTGDILKKNITPKTKAVVPVHLFGQSADMENIMLIARENGLFVVEDNAQAIGSIFTFSDGQKMQAGTIGDIGTTSFFPAKNLGAFGDGGAIFTNNEDFALKMKIIANHGQSKQYYHDKIGVNSRLDSIQAAILDVKLKYLDNYAVARLSVADYYDSQLKNISEIQVPVRNSDSTHVFHQYTLRVKNGKRDELKKYLDSQSIPCNIYYPVPLYKQKAFQNMTDVEYLPVTEMLCNEVLSLPIHTEMTNEIQDIIIQKIQSFFS
jgi:dTDP-4-amino-4,6-dideoxygalactose transaminase